jgi:hypothetical protein
MLPKKPDVAIEANVVLRDLVSLQEPSEIFVKPSKESWIIWVVSGYLDDVRAGSCQGVNFPALTKRKFIMRMGGVSRCESTLR